jgi:hypothetical protein
MFTRTDMGDNYFVTNRNPRPEPPAGGSNVVPTWIVTYYSTYQIGGTFTLLPPAPTKKWTKGPPEWEIMNFDFVAACFSCGNFFPWTIPSLGYITQFRIRNSANDYDADCFANLHDLPLYRSAEWSHCGVEPGDAPFLPPTWFYMNRDRHTLLINQSWVCEEEDQNLQSFFP